MREIAIGRGGTVRPIRGRSYEVRARGAGTGAAYRGRGRLGQCRGNMRRGEKNSPIHFCLYVQYAGRTRRDDRDGRDCRMKETRHVAVGQRW